MRLLLDTHILLAIAKEVSLARDSQIESAAMSPENRSFASAASIWEIAIKARLGKLALTRPVDHLTGYFESMGLTLLVIDHRHAVASVEPEPSTRDPFDRLLGPMPCGEHAPGHARPAIDCAPVCLASCLSFDFARSASTGRPSFGLARF